MSKYYAVKKGKNPGIYNSWSDCQKQINGFSGAKFHSFNTIEEAEKYMSEKEYEQKHYYDNEDNGLYYPLAFVDGSYNPKTKEYGYGVVLVTDKDNETNPILYAGNGNDEKIISMRNIAGELNAAIKAINMAIDLGLKEINIYYDYSGIEMWGNNQWNSSIPFVKSYKEFIKEKRNDIQINFIKVTAHTGVNFNEKADELAKKGAKI